MQSDVGTFVRAATLWASSASTSGSVSALRMVCCSFCSASSSFSWSWRFLSSLYQKCTETCQVLAAGLVLSRLLSGLRICFLVHRRNKVVREGRGRKWRREKGKEGWAGNEGEHSK